MALTKVTGAGIGTVTNQFSDANMSSGSVLQVVQTTSTVDSVITTATNFITVSITPSSTSNKILIMGVLASVARRNSTSSEGLYQLLRGDTVINTVDGITPWNGGATNERSVGSISFNYLDSPSTTSSISYHFRASCTSSGVNINNEGGISSLTVMEIVG